MPIERELFETLCCPVSKSPLRMMTEPQLEELNMAIAQGRARYAGGAALPGALEGALVTADGASAYGIRDGIPGLMPDLRIIRSGDTPWSTAASPDPTQTDPWADRWAEVSLLWGHIQPPVRPMPQDIHLLEQLVGETLGGADRPAPRALILGVTPDIATMRWPTGTQLLAVDSSMPMIRNVWPAREVPDAVVVHADWSAMPVRDAAYDFVVGDGSVNMLRYPDGFSALFGEVRRVLKDAGVFAMRVFARPEEREPLDTVFADLRGGRIGNLDLFNWRLAMALHKDLAAGTRLGDIWDAWHQNVPDPDDLMRSLGWPVELPRVFIDAMRGFEGRMTFPTVRELVEALAPDFDQTVCHVPEYETGDRYPTVVFKPRAR